MPFQSKPEAYTYALTYLRHIKQNMDAKDHKVINNAIDAIKIAFENHEQDPEKITQLISSLANDQKELATFSKGLKILATHVLNTKDSKLTFIDKFLNPLGRRFESELAIHLLSKPTKKMMTAVKAISNSIVALLAAELPLPEDSTRNATGNARFLHTIGVTNDFDYYLDLCGYLNHIPSIEEVKKILLENDPKNMLTIMFIHYQFHHATLRKTPFKHLNPNPPFGKLKDLISATWKKPVETFFTEALALPGAEGKKYRSLIDDKIYSSPLFRAPGNRGRGLSAGLAVFPTYLGLMRQSQSKYSINLPELNQLWRADCVSQHPNDSAYVTDLIDNDTVYVSGPSGMTSQLLGLMEVLGNFPTIEMKQHYLLCIASYILGGGYHSLHEVLGPAEYSLGLVPGYNISVPSKDKKAAPPNYYEFHKQMEKIDPEFAALREQIWNSYLDFFEQIFLPLNTHLQAFHDEKSEFFVKTATIPSVNAAAEKPTAPDKSATNSVVANNTNSNTPKFFVNLPTKSDQSQEATASGITLQRK